jgi:tripartite-type tricarboxylate transporter receptor subunit TctC
MYNNQAKARRQFVQSTAAASLMLLPVLASSQAAYPNKPIKVIVPFPAGGGGDRLARLSMTRAARELGQSVIFENIGGAGGNVGTLAGLRAEPDGYTVIYGTNGTLAVNQTLYKAPGFDSTRELQPVSRLTRLGLVLVVRPGFPAGSMPELLSLLKASPGKFTFGSAGNGTTSHLAGEIFKTQAGVSVVHIPYRGGAGAMTDLLGGQIDMMIEVMPSAMPQVQAGKIKGLAVSTAQRMPNALSLPTMAESGLPGFEVTAWDAITVPVGTPPAVVERLASAIRTALADPETIRQLATLGAEPTPSTTADLAQFIKTERERWGLAVKRSNASVD